MSRRIQVIINPASGQDRPVLGALNTAFQKSGAEWDATITKGAGDARRAAQEAVAAGVDGIAVYGGDGTITEVASGMIGSDIPLAILPGGTANAIAQALGIPSDLTEAIALAQAPDATSRRVDLGRADGRYFLIAIGIGIAGAIAEKADRSMKDRLGPLAYAVSTLSALRDTKPARYRLTLDGKAVEAQAVSCVVANSGSFGLPGLTLAQAILMDDGLLDVMLLSNSNIDSLVSVAASVVTGNDNTPMQRWQASKITVEADPPQPVQADGEVLEPKTPITIEVLPRAITVISPAKPPST